MAHASTRPSFTWREGLGYAFVLALIALGVAMGGLLARMFEPQGDWHAVAPVAELATDRPSAQYLDARDGARVRVWLSYVEGVWHAFDGLTPDGVKSNCPYAFQPVTDRFEDPCTGAKFDRDVRHIEREADRARAGNLIEYAVRVQDGILEVDLEDKRGSFGRSP